MLKIKMSFYFFILVIVLNLLVICSGCKRKNILQREFGHSQLVRVFKRPFSFINRYYIAFNDLPIFDSRSVVIFNQPKDTTVLFYASEYILQRNIEHGDKINLFIDIKNREKRQISDSIFHSFGSPKSDYPFDLELLAHNGDSIAFYEKYRQLQRTILNEFPYVLPKEHYYYSLRPNRYYDKSLFLTFSLDNSYSFTGDHFYGRITYIYKSKVRHDFVYFATDKLKN